MPSAMWTAWFAIYAARWHLGWTAELVSGSVLFAAMAGYSLTLLTGSIADHPVRTA